jgi:hypothetical protein
MKFPELVTIGGVITKIRGRVDEAVAAVPSDTAAAAVTNLIAAASRRVFTAWDDVDPILHTFASDVGEVRGNGRMTPATKRDDISALTATVNSRLGALVDTMTSEAAGTVVTLNRFDRFPRPQPVDADQHGALAALHGKWTMVLDRIDAGAARARIVRFVTDALVGGDELAVWALVSDDWTTLYAESRGIEIELLLQDINRATAPHIGPQAAEARRLRRVVDDGYCLTAVGPTASRYTAMGVDHIVNNPQLAGSMR